MVLNNILWGTDKYEKLGDGYKQTDQIQRELITGENGEVIKPRVAKSKEEQTLRSKTKAEVFTPSWVCNAQNNLIDEAWFGRKDVFNIEGDKTWEANSEPIKFTKRKGKTWEYYVIAPGSSLGGARPQANVVASDGSLWIAKFPSKNEFNILYLRKAKK